MVTPWAWGVVILTFPAWAPLGAARMARTEQVASRFLWRVMIEEPLPMGRAGMRGHLKAARPVLLGEDCVYFRCSMRKAASGLVPPGRQAEAQIVQIHADRHRPIVRS